MNFKEKIYDYAPWRIKNLLVTLFNFQNLLLRRTGKYRGYKRLHKKYESLDSDALISIQKEKYKAFIQHLLTKSEFYKERLQGIPFADDISKLQSIPVLEKDELRSNLDSIKTITTSKGLSAFTGGTTGMPLKVLFTKDDFRERVAIIDNFRERYGYVYGKSKVAWFSGRKILSMMDEKNKRFWRYDSVLRIRYYSTFHLSESNKRYYLNDLSGFQPEFMSGFPSSMYDLAEFIESNRIDIHLQLKAIFTTSETLLLYVRERLERVFNCKVYDQYASGEGAPYIYECRNGKKHYSLPSGIIEIVDTNNMPSKEGEMLVTSFTTYGTPLLRYRIGDYGVSSETECSCGLNYPVFERIEGRSKDFIYSGQRGKLYNAQIGDIVKAEITGLKNIQIIQDSISKISLNMVTSDDFREDELDLLISKLKDRVGTQMEIEVKQVENLHREESGKVKLIINNALDEINKKLDY